MKIEFQDTKKSFETAITQGIMSRDDGLDNAASNYMYMGHHDGVAQFKHSMTRQYINKGNAK